MASIIIVHLFLSLDEQLFAEFLHLPLTAPEYARVLLHLAFLHLTEFLHLAVLHLCLHAVAPRRVACVISYAMSSLRECLCSQL